VRNLSFKKKTLSSGQASAFGMEQTLMLTDLMILTQEPDSALDLHPVFRSAPPEIISLTFLSGMLFLRIMTILVMTIIIATIIPVKPANPVNFSSGWDTHIGFETSGAQLSTKFGFQ